MPVIGITGGIAAGKSTVSRLLASRLEAQLFDSDTSARELSLRADIKSKIRDEFGPDVFDVEGRLDRGKMRAIVFADARRKEKLEAIFHPAIRSQWMGLALAARENFRWLLVDIPLLFETGAEIHVDATVVVASSRETQLKRLGRDRGLERAIASKIIAAQMELLVKVEHADYVIWNDSTMGNVSRQTNLLAALLLARYGRNDCRPERQDA